MNIELCDEAREFGRESLRAFRAAGGDELLQRAETEPAVRGDLVEPLLTALGAWDLAPRDDAVELEAAAALCRSAGYYAVPYPIAERLVRVPESDGLIVVDGPEPGGAVAGLDLRWSAVTLSGERAEITPREPDSPPRTSMFVARLEPGPPSPVTPDGERDAALALALPCWTLLGMLDRAMDLARDHVLVREQFGRPLAEFQSVQFQLTDAEVERRGVEMLARYALWSIQDRRADALNDALAARLAAVEAADIVFRVAHQVHGALGFCDESPLSWLSRYSLPLRRFPCGRSGTEAALTRRIEGHGLAGLFSEPTGA
ncbi:acyl-CoA dehydrogenase family protein [Nocardia sp. NPDC057668]|uniref:acyl-CoA dehydrogenase family protein n=1 Tax=Nocardia sp. NPDC057668 TaxID=3346202 RepID=UPI00366FFC68